jgi:hypothetical protein
MGSLEASTAADVLGAAKQKADSPATALQQITGGSEPHFRVVFGDVVEQV